MAMTAEFKSKLQPFIGNGVISNSPYEWEIKRNKTNKQKAI